MTQVISTTYYWKVRASSSSGYSAWSAVSAFTTESAPVLEGIPGCNHSCNKTQPVKENLIREVIPIRANLGHGGRIERKQQGDNNEED